MKRKSAVNLLLLALLFRAVGLRAGQAAAADRPAGDSPQISTRAARTAGSAKEVDVCALLTSAEIEAVQGEPVKKNKPSAPPTGGVPMVPRFLSTATLPKTVRLNP